MKPRVLVGLLLWVAVMLLLVFHALLSTTGVSDVSLAGIPAPSHVVATGAAARTQEGTTTSAVDAPDDDGDGRISEAVAPAAGVNSVPPAAAVPNLLSQNSRRGELRDKVLRICKTHCQPKDGRPMPAMCNEAKLPVSPRWDTAGPAAATTTAAAAAGPRVAKTTVILCSVGTRFFGPGGQSYVLEAIPQWRLFNPPATSTVYLILHQQVMAAPAVQAMARAHAVELVDEASLDATVTQVYRSVFYIQGFMHPGGSRKTGHQQFNQFVSERFYYLAALMQQRNLSDVLHFENDIMVYDEMARHVQAAKACGAALASTVIDLRGFIPGALYIRDAASILRFCVFLNELLSCGENFGRALTRRWKDYANDMTYLMNYYHLFGTDALTILPGWEHRPGENCIFDATSSAAALDNGGSNEAPSKQKYLYDVASFGQWYSFAANASSGVPPKHVQDSMRKGRFLDATPLPLMTWRVDAAGRRQPFWKDYQLVSLHVHAKNLNKFRSKNWDV